VDVVEGKLERRVGEMAVYIGRAKRKAPKNITFEGKTSIRSNVAIYIAKQVPFHD